MEDIIEIRISKVNNFIQVTTAFDQKILFSGTTEFIDKNELWELLIKTLRGMFFK